MTWRWGLLAAGVTAKLNFVFDLLLLVGAIAIAMRWTSPDAHLGIFWFTGVAVAVWLFTSAALHHYDPMVYDRSIADDAALVTVHVMAITTVLGLSHLVWPVEQHLPTTGGFLLAFWPAALLFRIALFRSVSIREGPFDDVLIVGIGPIGRITGQDLIKRGRHHVVGHLAFLDEGNREEDLVRRLAEPDLHMLGAADTLEAVLRKTPVSEIYIAGNARRHADEMQQAIRVCERLGVPFAIPASHFRLERARPVDGKAVSDGYLHYLAVESKPAQMGLKRLFDIIASSLALWLLLPLLFIVAVIIKLTSRGPILFSQRRVGLQNRPFNMLKFRSMVVDAEAQKAWLAALNEQSGPVFKMTRDPRVTRIGRLIRKYSIDELPQLINVLRGEMSIVGPRPPLPAEVATYEAWQLRRLSVRPGLTCIWQVSGRNQISFDQWMYLDLQYIDHWSLARDFDLIFKTVPVVITGRGAS